MPKTKKFLELKKAVVDYYEGKKVPGKWQSKYGKRYSKKEAERIAYAIAKKRRWKV